MCTIFYLATFCTDQIKCDACKCFNSVLLISCCCLENVYIIAMAHFLGCALIISDAFVQTYILGVLILHADDILNNEYWKWHTIQHKSIVQSRNNDQK